MEIIQFVGDLSDFYRLEISISFFILMMFYFMNKNDKNFANMLSRKESVRDKLEEERRNTFERYGKNNDDLSHYDRVMKSLEKEYDSRVRDIQDDFDSKTLLNIETGIIVLLFIFFIISSLYFNG